MAEKLRAVAADPEPMSQDPSEETLFRNRWWPPAVFALLTVSMLGRVLFSRTTVLSSSETDLAAQFIPWREFGFGQMRQGHLPLWNPHIYGGAPYFAGSQSALLYPPNWLHLVLPTAPAINWGIALHVFLAGVFTYIWCRYRGISMVGAMLAGVLFMFSGQYFFHIFAGHLPHLCVMVWAPLLLLAIDGLAQEGSLRWVLVGIAAVAMQILAGHPQYVYYTALACGVYTLLNLFWSTHRLRLVLGYAGIYAGAAILTAVQLLAALQAVGENVRSGGLPFLVASSFSLHPENLLTLLSPFVLGNGQPGAIGGQSVGFLYFGRGYLWELCVFVSVTGLLLALYGLVCAEPRVRRLFALMLLVLMVLALGRYTPLYRVLYNHLPLFSDFRGCAKFAFLVDLLLAVLAGMGLDRILQLDTKQKGQLTSLGTAAFAVGALLGVAGFVVNGSAADPNGSWGRLLWAVAKGGAANGELFLFREAAYRQPEFLRAAAHAAVRGLFLSCVTLVGVGLLLFMMRYRRRWGYVIAGVAVVEILVFAHSTLSTTSVQPPDSDIQAVEMNPGDFRVLHADLGMANWAMVRGQYEIWGYDPGVLKRYAELMYFVHGQNPDEARQYLPPLVQLRAMNGILSMLRWRLILLPNRQPYVVGSEPMKHLAFVHSYRVLTMRKEILGAMESPTFDPRAEVILEEDPKPAPLKDGAGDEAKILRETSDELEISAELSEPAILLVTDNYSRGWRVRALDAGSQMHYQVIPADYVLRAIPLAAGKHHFILEYAPAGYRVGRWITIAALLMYLGLCWWACRDSRMVEARASQNR